MAVLEEQLGSEQWQHRLADVISAVGDESFCWRLADLFRSAIAFDDLMILLFAHGKPPVLLHGHSTSSEKQLLEKHYINGAYVLDPCYQMALNSRWGFFSFNDIAPDGFYSSELYRIYYEKSAVLEEMDYLIEGDDCFINISVTRFNQSPQFSQAEKERLQLLEPLVSAAVKEYLKQNIQTPEEEKIPLHKMMAEVLELFGTSLLTSRETHVVHLILKGYSAQSIADHLDISINTVKLHRKNAYAKLDIGSQSELFHLFIDSLTCIDDNFSKDPLVAYLKVPEGQDTSPIVE